ncbi:MAG: hypothetical protein U1E53_06845 [Dongiaceae bacterium]
MKAGSLVERPGMRVGFSEGSDVAIAFALLIGAAAWLILGTPVPPLADYPDNLARFFIESHAASDPQLASYYSLFWHFQPNLALDSLAYLLAPFCDIHTIGRLTVWATFVSLAAGCVLLYRALHGRYSVIALLACVLVINRYFTSGFLGFLMTLGWALIALAAWIHWRHRTVPRLLVGTVLATALYLGHLYALGIYAVCVLGYELHLLGAEPALRRRIVSRAAVALLHLIPAALIFFLLSPTLEASNPPEWRPLWDKLAGLVVLFPGYDLWLEAGLLGLVLLALGLAWALGWALLRRDFLIAEILLGLLYLAMPNILMSSYGADRRVIVPMAILAIVSFEWRAGSARLQALLWGLFAAVMAAQLAHVTVQWRSSQAMILDLLRLSHLVEPGSRVAGTTIIRTEAYLSLPPLHEIVSLFVPERSALVPNLYRYPGDAAAPIRYRHVEESFRPPGIYAPPGTPPAELQAKFDRFLANATRHGYQYLLLVDEPDSDLRLPPSLQPVGATANGRGRLFRIQPAD